MRRSVTAAVLFGGVLLASVSTIAQDDGFGPPIPPRSNGPKIEIPEPKFNWGEVLQGQKIEHVYKVLNQGTEALRITNVKPG